MKINQEYFTAAFPGTFDPFHYGHLSTAISFLQMHPKTFLYIILGINEEKEGSQSFSVEERIFLIEQTIPEKYKDRIKIVPFSKIIANYLYEQNIQVFIKGLRNTSDFGYESWIATVNSKLSGNPKTIFIQQDDPMLMNVSSSNLKDFTKWRIDTHHFAPALTREATQLKLNGQLLIALTGGIASGKSTLSKKLQELSKTEDKGCLPIYHISLDEFGKIIYSNDQTPKFLEIRKTIAEKFGHNLMAEDTSIDTYKLGNIAFASAEKLNALVEIILEPILYLMHKKFEELGKGIFLIESANLVEERLTHLFNENIIFVETTKKIQQERLIKRGMNEQQIKRRFGFQFSRNKLVEEIKKLQEKEIDRLFMRIDGTKETDIEKIYNKLQEEYKRRIKIIRI